MKDFSEFLSQDDVISRGQFQVSSLDWIFYESNAVEVPRKTVDFLGTNQKKKRHLQDIFSLGCVVGILSARALRLLKGLRLQNQLFCLIQIHVKQFKSALNQLQISGLFVKLSYIFILSITFCTLYHPRTIVKWCHFCEIHFFW